MVPAFTATQTVDRARALLESGRGAALPELLKLIETLSIDICKVTIGELAELIEKDGVILAKIVSVANKLAHNPGIAPIATLSQAIHQLGYNRIRTIAVSLMLLDNAGAANPPEQRDAAALALSAGLVAQGAAEFTGTHDPELAFACAALRNLGRILMAAISPEHYREALELTHKEPAVDGFKRRFGLPALELSRKVLAGSKLPEDVVKALRDAEPETLRGVASQHEMRLLALADYGGRLATLSLDEHEADDGFVRKVTLLGKRFQRLIPQAEDVATPALLKANERLRSFTRCSGVSGLPTASLARIRQRLELVAPGAAREAEKAEVLPVGLTASGIAEAMALAEAETEAAADAQKNAPPGEPAAAATEAPIETPVVSAPAAKQENTAGPVPAAAEAPLPAASPTDVTAPPFPGATDAGLPATTTLSTLSAEGAPQDALGIALAIARDAVAAKECWFFRRAPGATSLSIASGVGPLWMRYRARATIRGDERTLFGLSLARSEVVLIHDIAEAALKNYLPPWWREIEGGPRAFALIPIGKRGERANGLVLVGWPEARRLKISPGHVSLVQQLFAALQPATPKAA